MGYVETRINDFTADVEAQSIDEMFSTYSKVANTVIIYKLGKYRFSGLTSGDSSNRV